MGYKLKTKKSLAKRLKFTKKGKIKRRKGYHGHILSKKSSKRKRRLRQKTLIDKYNIQDVRRLMPYG